MNRKALIRQCETFVPSPGPGIGVNASSYYCSKDGDLLRECAPRRVVLSHLAPGFFGQTGFRERALATLCRHYKGIMLMPDELMSLDLTRARHP